MTAESERGPVRRTLQRSLYWAAWAVLGLAAYGIYLDASADGYRDGNGYLKQEIRQLDTMIAEVRRLEEQRTAILERLAIIDQLNERRGDVLNLLNVLSASDEAVSISSLDYVDGRLTLTGEVRDATSLPAFMVMLSSYGYDFDGTEETYRLSGQTFRLTVRRQEYRDED